jgi:hypothetical protein
MSEHSKGPWQVSKPQIHGSGLSVDIDSVESGHYALATVVWQMEDDKFDDKPSEQCIANAYLIAAAPDLLAALESLLGAAYNAYADSSCADVMVEAEAAIAKAKGITQ